MNYKTILHETGKDPLYKIWHSGAGALFMFVHSGSGSVVTKERNYPLAQNALLLIAPGTYHYTLPEEPAAYDRSKIILPAAQYNALFDLLRDPFLPAGHPILYAPIPAESLAAVEQCFLEAAGCKGQAENAPLALACILRLLYYLKRYATKNTFSAASFISDSIQYIHKNITAELNLDRICAAINISKYYFCRQFKLQMGITVMQYILHTRIMLARDALKKTNLSITQISEQCGFSSVSYFCQAFKDEAGRSPLQYRKEKSEALRAP